MLRHIRGGSSEGFAGNNVCLYLRSITIRRPHRTARSGRRLGERRRRGVLCIATWCPNFTLISIRFEFGVIAAAFILLRNFCIVVFANRNSAHSSISQKCLGLEDLPALEESDNEASVDVRVGFNRMSDHFSEDGMCIKEFVLV